MFPKYHYDAEMIIDGMKDLMTAYETGNLKAYLKSCEEINYTVKSYRKHPIIDYKHTDICVYNGLYISTKDKRLTVYSGGERLERRLHPDVCDEINNIAAELYSELTHSAVRAPSMCYYKNGVKQDLISEPFE